MRSGVWKWLGCFGSDDPAGPGRPVRQEQAQGILIEALGMLTTHFGSEKAVCTSGFAVQEQPVRFAERAPAFGRGRK